jgi:hypothetical protein
MPKSRGNGEGSVKKLPSGKWQASTMIGYKPDGKPLIAYATGETQEEALRAIMDIKENKNA